MAPRIPRVGRWTSPSTTMRPIPAIERATSADSLTRLTRRTVPGSSAANSVIAVEATYALRGDGSLLCRLVRLGLAGGLPVGEALAGPLQPGHVADRPFPRLFGLGVQPLDRLEPPLPQHHGHED